MSTVAYLIKNLPDVDVVVPDGRVLQVHLLLCQLHVYLVELNLVLSVLLLVITLGVHLMRESVAQDVLLGLTSIFDPLHVLVCLDGTVAVE